MNKAVVCYSSSARIHRKTVSTNETQSMDNVIISLFIHSFYCFSK